MMRRCNKILTSLISVFIIIASAVSCGKEYNFGFKDLCFYHPHTAPVQLDVDWTNFERIIQPKVNDYLSGMTVYVWPLNTDEIPYTFPTHNVNTVTLDLKSGNFNALVFNLTDDEYGSLGFHNLDEYDKAEVRVLASRENPLSTKNWISTKDPESKVGVDPEWLAVDRKEEFVVTEEMVEIAEEEFLATLNKTSQNQRSIPTKTQNFLGTLTPRTLVKQIDLLINLTNYKSLAIPEGALSGLAEGCYLASGKPTSEEVIHIVTFTELKSKVDQSNNKDEIEATLCATIRTFGVPEGHTGLPNENILSLQFTLRNRELETLYFDVGDQIADLNSYDGTNLSPDGRVVWPTIHLDVELPFIEIDDGMFDVTVPGWGEEYEQILPLN